MARSLGLSPGFYANNYICGEGTPYGGVGGAEYMKVMEGSVRFLKDNDFGCVRPQTGSTAQSCLPVFHGFSRVAIEDSDTETAAPGPLKMA